MIFFLILGMVLGGVSIIFMLQNITPVTVSFFAYQLNGSLALIIFASLLAGMLISVLVLLPNFIRDEFRINKLKKQNKDLEDELAARPTVIETTPTNLPM